MLEGWTWLYEPAGPGQTGQTNTHTDKYKHNTIPTQYHPQYPLDLPKITLKQTFLAGYLGNVDAGERFLPTSLLSATSSC